MEHSQRILECLRTQGITAYRLAKETGISESLFSKWKKRPTSNISAETLNKIASYLGCSTDELLGKNQGSSALSRGELSTSEMKLLKLFRAIPEDHREMVLRMIEAALDNL